MIDKIATTHTFNISRDNLVEIIKAAVKKEHGIDIDRKEIVFVVDAGTTGHLSHGEDYVPPHLKHVEIKSIEKKPELEDRFRGPGC